MPTFMRTIGTLCILLLLSTLAFAQAGVSSVTGTVTDQQGKVVPNATVTLTNLATNITRVQKTSDTGLYAFSAIPAGEYRLEAEGPGFKKTVINNVRLLVSKPTEVNVQFEVGQVMETVTVSTSATDVLLNTVDATLGNNIVAEQIAALPLDAKDVSALLTLQPGVTRAGYVNGARSDQSNITLDGVDINEAQTNSLGGTSSTALPTDGPVIRLNSEAIEEFRVTTSNANATQGRSSGAQISLVSKGGTNAFHGSLFNAHRNTITTANDFFLNRNGQERKKLIRNTFGGSFSGPLVKDKLFFFYSFEGDRIAQEDSGVRVVPLPSLGQGQIRYRNPSGGITTLTQAEVNSIFPDVGVNPAALTVLAAAAAKYPANDTTVGDGLNTSGFRFKASTPSKRNSHGARIDFNLNSAHQFFARGNVLYDLVARLPQFPDTAPPSNWSHPVGLVLGHTWNVSNNLVNNFRYGLTREAFTDLGDARENAITFRFVYSPLLFARDISRTTPVTNFTDDLVWLKGNHTLQFGTNIRMVKNRRATFASAFDNAVTNPSFYQLSGRVLSNPINAYSPFDSGFRSSVQNAAAAVIGRFSQYGANFIFSRDGTPQPAGTPSAREFATQEYDFYIQDVWKLRSNLTFTYGLRYGLSRPVYETGGYEVKPNIPLGTYFERRLAAAALGQNYDDPITVDLSGPANGKSSMYHWDKNNFQPRVALAWSPNFENSLLRAVFGSQDQTVIRGGFGMTNDYYGNQLAVSFDLNNTLGFSSNTTISANTYNVGNTSTSGTTPPNVAPLFTAFGQSVRTLPGITVPGTLTFPQQKPADGARRIESSLDENLVAPTHYNWNLTVERQLPGGMLAQASYVGRRARNLLATRDVMAINNLVDPVSKMDWYTAAGMLAQQREAGVAATAIAPIAYFQNLFPASFAANLGYDPAWTQTQAMYQFALDLGADWTFVQDLIDAFGLSNTGLPIFYQSQYGALAAFGSIGNSNYDAFTFSLRQRLQKKLILDVNYSFSHSLDDSSGLQTEGGFGNAFILNPIRQRDNYANSDFDVRHQINISGVWTLPFGRGEYFGGNANSVVNAIIGGWQFSGIYRWNTGLPISAPYDDAFWATNWNVQSNGTRTQPVTTCPTTGIGSTIGPKLFGCNTLAAYQSWRNARPGETGERNTLRLPGYVAMDMGLGKSFNMPFEGHKMQFRWEVFNLTNTQRMGAIDFSRSGYGITLDPNLNNPPPNWSNFTGIQGAPRKMQFSLRYSF